MAIVRVVAGDGRGGRGLMRAVHRRAGGGTDDVAIAQRIRERDATGTGDRATLAAAAAEFGIDLEAL